MSKAQQRALEAYPPKYVKQERHSKRMQSERIDTHQPMRAIYIKGYQQAEKDLELTWKDIEKVCLIAREVHQFRGFWSESVYQEVLERFKEKKGKEV
jgi:hypothetical protein